MKPGFKVRYKIEIVLESVNNQNVSKSFKNENVSCNFKLKN